MNRILALALFSAPLLTAAPDLVLHGAITRSDYQTYREVPFQVPAGATRITVEFSYTGKDQRTTIDIGLLDPERLRLERRQQIVLHHLRR
jgi:hypothetical protein